MAARHAGVPGNCDLLAAAVDLAAVKCPLWVYCVEKLENALTLNSGEGAVPSANRSSSRVRVGENASGRVDGQTESFSTSEN